MTGRLDLVRLVRSAELRDLRDRGLLELKDAGSASFYLIGPRAHRAADVPKTADRGEPGTDRGEPGTDRGELGTDRGELPDDLKAAIGSLGPRPRKERLRPVILRLCELRAWRAAELAKVLGLGDPQKLVERHLGPLCDEHILERVYPERLSHPDQAYRAVQRSL